MWTVFIAALLKPFVALAVLVPVRVAVSVLYERMPETRLKRLLFTSLGGSSRPRGDTRGMFQQRK